MILYCYVTHNDYFVKFHCNSYKFHTCKIKILIYIAIMIIMILNSQIRNINMCIDVN